MQFGPNRRATTMDQAGLLGFGLVYFKVQGLGFRVQGLGFRIFAGFRVQAST